MRRGYAETRWGQIHYRYEGKGDALFLLHQSPWSSAMFEKAMPIFGRHYRVIAIDIPGHGESDKPPRHLGIPDYASCAADVLEALGIKKTAVVGHHTGGGIGVELAVSHPGRVTRLVIYGPPYWEAEERKRILETWTPPPELKENGSHLMRHWELAKRLSPNGNPELWHRSVLETLKAGEYCKSAYKAILEFDMGPRLPLLNCPTLVMCGDQDMLFKATKPVLALIPRARELIIPETGDPIVDLRTEVYTEAVLDFLASPEGHS